MTFLLATCFLNGSMPICAQRGIECFRENDAEKLPSHVYLGAPYIVQLPSGPTVLSFQLENDKGVQQMVVFTGDEQARDFDNMTRPFSMAGDVSSVWNSLFAKDHCTVTAISGTQINGIRGVWIIDGTVR